MKSMILSTVLAVAALGSGFAFASPAPANSDCCGMKCCDKCPTCCKDCCEGDCCGEACCGSCPTCCK